MSRLVWDLLWAPWVWATATVVDLAWGRPDLVLEDARRRGHQLAAEAKELWP